MTKIIIRSEQPTDIPLIHHINELVFERPEEARLVNALRESPYWIDDLSLVAVMDDVVIGHLLITEISITSGDHIVPALGAGPMAVLPEYQGKGIGSALMRHALDRCKEHPDYSLVVLIGHAGYYPRFGFKPARPNGFSLARWEKLVSDDAFMVYELQPGALKETPGLISFPTIFDEAL